MSIHNIDSTSPPLIEAVIVPPAPTEVPTVEAPTSAAATGDLAAKTAELEKVNWPMVVGKEFWNYILLAMVANLWVPRFVGPIASLITGEREVSPVWRMAVVITVLLGYGFCVGQSDPKKRVVRILLQTFLTVGSGVLGIVLASKVTATRVLYLAFAGTALSAGALTGWLLSSDDKTQKEAAVKKPEKKSNPIQTVILSVIGLAIGFGILFGAQFLGTAAQRSIYVDKAAPETIFETADGQPWTFADQRGKVVLVKFWAPYCAPCVASFPSQHRTYEEFSQHADFEMVSVSVGHRERSIKMFEDKQAAWKQVFPPEESGPNDLRPYGIPAAYIIDRDGKVFGAQLRGGAVDAELRKLFREE